MTTPTLRTVDPDRTAGPVARAYAAMAARPWALFISRHVNWKLDPVLLRLTRGRVATTLFFPTAVLETRGARSGEPRRNAIIYAADEDRFVIVASNGGGAHHPAWLHNLRAQPDVIFGGIPMRATEVLDDDERDRLAARADRVFPSFATYRTAAARHGRSIPIVELRRR